MYSLKTTTMVLPVTAALLFAPGLAPASDQNMLRPASEHAANIETLWWFMFWGATLIFAAVMFLLGLGLWRARRGGEGALGRSASRRLVLAAGVAVPLAVIVTLVGGSLLLGRSMAGEAPPGALTIRVTGWSWWWEVEYLDRSGQVLATTANEIHVPVGRPVRVLLSSADVIHSFWVPQLHGKTDLVPGETTQSWFTASRAGSYRGQCAEFCGVQHALMAFLVIAEPQDQFERWLQREGRDADVRPQMQAGLRVFLDRGCGDCHRIRGTAADGERGPDLTHMASRRTLAAVTIPNSRGHLGGWISDPDAVKPGVFMPRTLMEPEALTALTAFLESLD